MVRRIPLAGRTSHRASERGRDMDNWHNYITDGTDMWKVCLRCLVGMRDEFVTVGTEKDGRHER